MSDSVDRSDALDEKIGESSSIRSLINASRHNRRMIRLLSVSIALDIALSVGLGIVAFRANETANKANSVQNQARTACLAGNESRSVQLQLWSYILDSQVNQAQTQTPAQKQQVEQFRIYIHKAFAPRRC